MGGHDCPGCLRRAGGIERRFMGFLVGLPLLACLNVAEGKLSVFGFVVNAFLQARSLFVKSLSQRITISLIIPAKPIFWPFLGR